MVMSAGEREAALEDIKDRPMPQLQRDLAILLERLNVRLMDYFKGEADILQFMAQERERNQFLECELSSREDRIRPANLLSPDRDSHDVEQDIEATEIVVNELEAQL